MIFPGAFRIADSLPHSLRLFFRIFVVQFVLGACLASSMAYAAGAELPQATPLRVAVYDVPPYGYVNPDGSLSGISVDLWRRVAERLERQFKLIPVSEMEAILSGLEQGHFDAAMARSRSQRKERNASIFPIRLTGRALRSRCALKQDRYPRSSPTLRP
jgi:polar amino acid transport system substrate-binding protein